MSNELLERLRFHVTGAIERGESKPVYEVREWEQFYALEVDCDWHPICQKCVQYVSASHVVNYYGSSPYLYQCQLCHAKWETILKAENYVI